MGNSIIETPHLDSLAQEGLLFNNAFCTTSICCTSRATILTGQYARRHGIWSFREPLTEEAFSKTFPAVLRQNGYDVAFIGKWGLGGKLPIGEYDHWQGFSGQGRYYEKNLPHLTRRIASQTQAFLESRSADRPFCLQVSFKAAHCQDGAKWQFQHAPAYRERYAQQEIPTPSTAHDEYFQRLPAFLQNSEARVRWKLRFADQQMFQKSVKDYYRLITGVDDVVGEIVDKLKEKHLDQNTIIIYTTDQGFYLGDHGLAGKWFMHDVSIRIPLLIFDPRSPADRRGKKIESMVLTTDLAPTILNLAGVKVPSRMQGKSLLPLIDNPTIAWRDEMFYEHLFEHGRIPKSEGVRTERWKYIRYVSTQPEFEQLYDLKNDPLETNDLSHSVDHQDKLAEMRQKWQQHRQQAQ